MLKKILISTALAAATIAPVFAQQAAPLNLTPAEKKVQSLLFAFQDCIAAQQKVALDKGTAIAADRAKTAKAATAASLKKNGVSDEDAGIILSKMEPAEAQFVAQLIFMAGDPAVTCKKQLRINDDQMKADLQALGNKYGPAVFERPDAPAPN